MKYTVKPSFKDILIEIPLKIPPKIISEAIFNAFYLVILSKYIFNVVAIEGSIYLVNTVKPSSSKYLHGLTIKVLVA